MKHLLLMVLIGGGVWCAELVWTIAQRAKATHSVRVDVPPGATKAERDALAKSEVLVDYAERKGWVSNDQVVFVHLVQTMRYVMGEQVGGQAREQTQMSDEALFHQALELGLHKTDAVVRARLEQLAWERLAEPMPKGYPPPAMVRDFYEVHRDKFRSLPSVEFEHQFYRTTDASLVKPMLPSPLPGVPAAGEHEHRNLIDVYQRYGAKVYDVLKNQTVGEWSALVKSRYGLHRVRVVSRTSEAQLPFNDVAKEISAELRDDFAATSRERAYKRLFSDAKVQWVER